jgi:hypothetical protein
VVSLIAEILADEDILFVRQTDSLAVILLCHMDLPDELRAKMLEWLRRCRLNESRFRKRTSAKTGLVLRTCTEVHAQSAINLVLFEKCFESVKSKLLTKWKTRLRVQTKCLPSESSSDLIF